MLVDVLMPLSNVKKSRGNFFKDKWVIAAGKTKLKSDVRQSAVDMTTHGRGS